MSAMRAAELPELPELPPALPQERAQIRAAARWAGPAPQLSSPTSAGLPSAPPQPPRSQPVRSQSPRSQPVRNEAARSQPASAPLRLTRRGRVVVAVAAVLLLTALSLVIAASAQATNHPVPRAAQQDITQMTVRPGQSLWSVAESADPDADTRVVIQQIVELNGLTGNVVFAGERLWVPRA
jgi:LysM repeat protein